ncbi:serine/threonine protein phosphatase [Formosa sp. S-31]|uniref:serine/threonine protein phosphatase n=1 Tax=Formosa sp. S-31 TaxID=2790949 RepID=UPI003EBB4A0A
MFVSRKRLDKAYKTAKRISFDSTSKFIFFSDCHRGDNSFADDFANNRNLYYHALKYYCKHDFHYCELGDGNELWENLTFKTVFEAHKNVYLLIKQFHDKQKLDLIWGNHDMVCRNPGYVKRNFYTYFEPTTGLNNPLFPDIKFHEGIVLQNKDTAQEIFLTHGHQADSWNYTFWKLSRFMVRILWKPLNVMGISDPTSPAKNYTETIRIERRIKTWIKENNNLITIVGHTHRPRFPEPGHVAFFNDGSCVHPHTITGLEIENGQISLIKWDTATTDDGYIRIVRSVLEGPKNLEDYKTD